LATFLDFTFQYVHVFLSVILIGLVTLILSLFIKKRRTLIVVMVVLIISSLIVVNQMKYTTLAEHYSEQLNEDTVVESISITIMEAPWDMPRESRSILIEQKDIINQILEDISNIELKKDDDIQLLDGKFQVKMIVTNQISEDHFKTTTIHLDLDENFVNDFRIISKTNHLKTIASLFDEDIINKTDVD
jgi:hypothetical protein